MIFEGQISYHDVEITVHIRDNFGNLGCSLCDCAQHLFQPCSVIQISRSQVYVQQRCGSGVSNNRVTILGCKSKKLSSDRRIELPEVAKGADRGESGNWIAMSKQCYSLFATLQQQIQIGARSILTQCLLEPPAGFIQLSLLRSHLPIITSKLQKLNPNCATTSAFHVPVVLVFFVNHVLP